MKGNTDVARRGNTVRITAKGKKPITFERGALHRALGVPQGQPIPASKRQAALRGAFGPKVKKQAVFAYKGALAAGRAKARSRKK